jgi:ketosteroid isomerase-like protein
MASAVAVHRAAHDAFNSRDWDRMRELFAPDGVYTDHARGMALNGVDEFLGWLREWTAGMSDARVEERRYLDAGTHSICRFQGRGVNDGQLGPANATGKSLDLAFCEILESDGERITGGEMYYDSMTMMAQFGVVEAPAGA